MLTDEWLIRTVDNRISGPYTRTQVCELIRLGEIAQKDEVCQANSYWIGLHEKEEIQRFLGIEVPDWKVKSDDEATLIQTEPYPLKTAGFRNTLPPQERRPYWLDARWVLAAFGVVLVLALARLLNR